jgi:enterochelin esterase-like enzyme
MAVAGLAAVVGAAIAVPLAGSAAADAGDPLGPTVVRTDAPPTGYAVKFRYEAPAGVSSVQIYGDWFFAQPPNAVPNHPPSQWQSDDFAATDWRILPMTLGEDGVWEITVPLPAGTFRYAFTHDCTNQLATGCTLNYDPANPWQIFPQYPGAPGAVRSTVFVPSNPDFPSYDNDYQQPLSPQQMGTLESVRYAAPTSTNPAGVHDMLVYTPHGYDPDRAIPYPTLYISHGAGDHSTAWFMQGVAHYIVQNAIDEGVVQDMVVVSTDFNGLPGGNQGYANHLRDVVIPYMQANYNVSTRSEDRAFGGFSAGGSRAFTIMYDNTNLFAYHASWSWGGPAANATQVARMKSVPGGIMIGTGLQDQTGNIGVTSPARAAALRAQGVPLVEFNMNGMHTWHVWRPMLNFYLRNIAFRTTTTGLEVEAIRAGNSHMVRIIATASVDPVTTTSVTPPSGAVEFYAGDTLLGTAEIENGTAIFRRAVDSALLTEPIVAKYQGDNLFNPSTSTAVAAVY